MSEDLSRPRPRLLGGASILWAQVFSPKARNYVPVVPSDYPLKGSRYRSFERAIASPFASWVEPNHLTYLRILVGVVMLVLGAELSYLSLLLLTAFAGLTDFYDGALARSRGKKTRLGVALDPFADKLLAVVVVYQLIIRGDIAYTLLFLMLAFESHVLMVPLLCWLYRTRVSRDDRAFSPLMKLKDRVVPLLLGRIKLSLYVFAVLLITLGRAVDSAALAAWGNYVLWVGLGVAFLALLQYLARCRSLSAGLTAQQGKLDLDSSGSFKVPTGRVQDGR